MEDCEVSQAKGVYACDFIVIRQCGEEWNGKGGSVPVWAY